MSLIKNLLGIFKTTYTPEKGEVIEKTFKKVWISKGLLTGLIRHTVVVTNKKLVISGNSLGGYPGFRFYFDPNTKIYTGFNSFESIIQDAKLEDGVLVIDCVGGFKQIKLHTKEYNQELFTLIKGKLRSGV